MATHDSSTPQTTPSTGRRAVLALAGAFSATGIVAGGAASVADMGPHPDAELLALRPRLDALLDEVSATEMADGTSVPPGRPYADYDAWLSRIGEEFCDLCWEVVDMPPARTAEGLAFQSAAAMHQFRSGYGPGGWPGEGEEMAWQLLSRLAGDAFVPPQVPAGCDVPWEA